MCLQGLVGAERAPLSWHNRSSSTVVSGLMDEGNLTCPSSCGSAPAGLGGQACQMWLLALQDEYEMVPSQLLHTLDELITTVPCLILQSCSVRAVTAQKCGTSPGRLYQPGRETCTSSHALPIKPKRSTPYPDSERTSQGLLRSGSATCNLKVPAMHQ
jgi:hypothetical protein